jgi:hypothetical protein
MLLLKAKMVLSHRSALLWIHSQFGLALLFFLLSVGAHVYLLMGGTGTRSVLLLFGSSISVALSITALRERRSLWPNEINACPRSTLFGLLAVMIYVVGFIAIHSLMETNEGVNDFPVIASAIAMLLNAYSAILSRAIAMAYGVEKSETLLARKATDSLLAFALGAILLSGICLSHWH